MYVTFDKAFLKSIKKLKNKDIKTKIADFIIELENTEQITNISSIKKLSGDSYSYRKRIGDFRIGFEIKNNTAHIIIIAHRKDIYKSFP